MALEFEGRATMAAELRHAFAASGHFRAVVDDPAQSRVRVAIDETRRDEGSNWVVLNIVFMGLLPLPMTELEHGVLARMQVGSLDEVALPRVERTIHGWGGLPLLPLLFIQSDESKVKARIARDVATHAAATYARLHAEAWEAAQGPDAVDALESFFVSFPGSIHADRAAARLEERLHGRVQRSGSALDHLRYLVHFPAAPRAEDVRRMGAGPVWRKISQDPSIPKIEEYLKLFGSHALAREATPALESLFWNRAERARGDADLYRACLERFPTGSRAAACRDVLAWTEAEESLTPPALLDYLTDHPDGRFAAVAAEALEDYGDSTLMGIAAGIPDLVDQAMRAQFDPSRMRGSGTVSGSLLSSTAGHRISVRYDAEVSRGFLRSHTLHAGLAVIDGAAFRLASDGRWYPAFPLVFTDPVKVAPD